MGEDDQRELDFWKRKALELQAKLEDQLRICHLLRYTGLKATDGKKCTRDRHIFLAGDPATASEGEAGCEILMSFPLHQTAHKRLARVTVTCYTFSLPHHSPNALLCCSPRRICVVLRPRRSCICLWPAVQLCKSYAF